MKKSIKAIIAATFTAALLAGCSSNTASTTTAAETTAAETTTAEATTAGSADAADTALADGSYTIGINQFAVHGSLDNCREGFIEGLAENGFVEGKNLTVLEENAQADPGLAAQISTNFAGQKVDLICAIATPSAQSAYSVGRKNDIPVIYTAVTDPVAAELANADGTPVGEVTGTSDKLPVEQQLEMIRAILPDAKKIGIMYTTSEVNSASTLAEYKEKAADYGFEIVESGVSSTADIPLAADSLLEQVDCLNNLTDNTVVASLPLILSKANAVLLRFHLQNPFYTFPSSLPVQMQENFPLHHSSYRSDEFSPASDHQDKSIQTVPDLSIPTVFQMRPDHYLAGVPKYFASASSSNPSPITISTFCPSPTGFI